MKVNFLSQLGKHLNVTRVVFFGVLVFLSGCQSTSSNQLSRVTTVGPSMSGPSSASLKGTMEKPYPYDGRVFMDVAIPVFDPGFPLTKSGQIDDEEMVEQDIWPQVRRLEANRFAIETKKALATTKAFGAISVTPDASSSADLFIIGRINHSDAEVVNIGVRVIDASNVIWGEKTFEHQVNEGFFRDALRQSEDPYGPVFRDIANYVFRLMVKRSDAEKEQIQQIADMRYAAMYSPESFGSYLNQNRKQQFSLNGLPSEQDPMFLRIDQVRAKDEQFVDNLQTNYEAFYAETNEAYRTYQREALPIAAEIRRKKAQRTKAQAWAAVGIIGGVLLSKNSDSTAGNIGAVVATAIGAYNLADAVQQNKAIGAQREMLEEQGQNLDIKVTPQVVEFNDQTIELSGTAKEQYGQLRQKLYEIYQLEATPDTAL
ncbi:hypothetical protein NI389_15985 [Pseudoalteromonas xiamenensis]|uniref:hypothetical protein n=1 Tax=Pseudoalteromonas xiamenensis TaxID=882626 RepID=UPI0027E5A8E9|nr:hypothetical protein [Pseudoalteromonas xiamenensis]WMN59658.1 hypothetical protein NI389_15985 [Pseudoalteromonas xiamenensis]